MSENKDMIRCRNCGKYFNKNEIHCPYCNAMTYRPLTLSQRAEFLGDEDIPEATPPYPLSKKLIIDTIFDIDDEDEVDFYLNKRKKELQKKIRSITHFVLPHFSLGMNTYYISFVISCIITIATFIIPYLEDDIFLLIIPLTFIPSYIAVKILPDQPIKRSPYRITRPPLKDIETPLLDIVNVEKKVKNQENNYTFAIIGMVFSIFMWFRIVNLLIWAIPYILINFA